MAMKYICAFQLKEGSKLRIGRTIQKVEEVSIAGVYVTVMYHNKAGTQMSRKYQKLRGVWVDQ